MITFSADLQRWTRRLYITLPILLLANYLILFQWPLLEHMSANVFPHESFHPAPFVSNEARPHGSEAPQGTGQMGGGSSGKKDYWTWKTPTRFGLHAQNSKGNAASQAEADCESFPTYLLDKIQVVLKTGAADDVARTDVLLRTVVRCIDNLIVVSDDHYPFGSSEHADHTAIDVLEDLPASTYLGAEDYETYARQRNGSYGTEEEGSRGRKLDKYKFLPAVEHAVAKNPEAEWFVFLETDSYVFWDNVFRMLENYEPSLPYYFGSPSSSGRRIVGGKKEKSKADDDEKLYYASASPAIILSSAAAHRLADRNRNSLRVTGPRLSDEFKQEIREDCCGDSVLGWALRDKGKVRLSGLWPMFNPHSASSVPFGRKYWCEPVLALSGVGSDEMQGLWRWEGARDRRERPLLHADLALSYHRLGNFSRRANWHAADWDAFHFPPAHASHASVDACESECREEQSCFQWTFHKGKCWMVRSMRLGRSMRKEGAKGKDGGSGIPPGPVGVDEKEEGGTRRRDRTRKGSGLRAVPRTTDTETEMKAMQKDKRDKKGENNDATADVYTSGWDVNKIERWKKEHECDEGAHWVMPSTQRRYGADG